MDKTKSKFHDIYLDTQVKQMYDNGLIEKTVLRACQAAKPPMTTAGDIVEHLKEHGSFSDVPGCRRPRRIPAMLVEIANNVTQTLTPSWQRPVLIQRHEAERLIEMADFDFLDADKRNAVLEFRDEHGHLPMFVIIRDYLNRPLASRNDQIMAYYLGFDKNENSDSSEVRHSLAEISNEVNLSRERVRQIAMTYTLPEPLAYPMLWKAYANHKSYYADQNHPAYIHASTHEIAGLSFAAYAAILHRTTMLQNVDDKYLARRGWAAEIGAWVDRLSKLASFPRSIESRVSIQGLAQGGKLDARIRLVVLRQIAPSLGLKAIEPDGLILPKNTE